MRIKEALSVYKTENMQRAFTKESLFKFSELKAEFLKELLKDIEKFLKDEELKVFIE